MPAYPIRFEGTMQLSMAAGDRSNDRLISFDGRVVADADGVTFHLLPLDDDVLVKEMTLKMSREDMLTVFDLFGKAISP